MEAVAGVYLIKYVNVCVFMKGDESEHPLTPELGQLFCYSLEHSSSQQKSFL